MTIVVSPIRKVSIYEMADATFGTDHSTAGTGYLAIPAVTDSFQFTIDDADKDPMLLQQYKHGNATHRFGPKSSTVSYEIPLGVTGTLANATTTTLGPSVSALFRSLKIVMGGMQYGKRGSDVVSGTAGAFVITTAHGTRFTSGG